MSEGLNLSELATAVFGVSPEKKLKTPKPASKHALKRATERFGIVLTDSQYWSLCRDCLRKRTELLGRFEGGIEIHRAFLENTKIFLVFDRKKRLIKTFLTKGMVKERLKYAHN